MDRLRRFIQATPINRRRPGEYLMQNSGFGWYEVFDQELLSRDELAELSGSEAKDEALRRLKDFMGSDESEYGRIDDYFRCLAFRPDNSASTRDDSP